MWAAPFGLALTLLASPAVGAESAAVRSYSLAYAAPSGLCPGSERFLEGVRARAPSAELRTSDADLAFDVTLTEERGLARGVLAVRFRAGEHFMREVPPAECDDVLTTMAIIASLLLSGALLPEPAPVAPAAPPPGAEATREAEPPLDTSALRAEPPVAPAPAPSPTRPPARPAPASLRVDTGVFLDARLDFGAAPFPAFGVLGGLTARIQRSGWFSPSARLGLIYVEDRADHQPVGSARFVLVAGTVRACPLHVSLPASFAFDACALFEGGRLEVSPRATPAATGNARMPWLAFGAADRVEAPLAGRVSVEAELAGFGLVRHDEFVLQPGVVVHQVPAFSGALSLGLVARVP